ncbi:hypothetical protein CMUS01_13349 [Colletotrichum musicola]|uniref:Concanavalin A-like lectin/glucanase n=1 Tax=Colletotrichum musicola TaxID=2175873 RepID=A0A8H6JDC8_9PEZI|nr:hypothetical protein CMUS01_13349 [Colletotrichum musicola]
MRSTSFAAVAVPLAARAVAAQYDDWKFGNMFNIGPASSAIAKATWSLVPPSIPCGTVTQDKKAQPWMSIWVGISQSLSDQGTDLFQPLLNWAPNNAQEGCPASNSEWCVAASTYTGAGIQVAQPYVAIPSKSDIDFELSHDASKGVSQKVWINGALVSQQTDKDTNGKAPTYIFSSNECYKGTCGTLDAYNWSNLTVTLTKADPNFGKTLQLTGASSSGLKTSDNGKTWHADSIKINQDYFYADGSKKQC